MKFYNRQQEIFLLKNTINLASTVGAQLTILVGRRRIGKTELIKEAFKKERYLYFFVSRKKSLNLLNEFQQIFNQATSDDRIFVSWDQFIKKIFQFSIETKTILVFDEFQNFYQLNEAIFDIFQKNWDEMQKQKNLNLVVAGSIISLLEKIFYDKKEPLYKRATEKINLKELDFQTIKEILEDNQSKRISLKELLNFYTIFGGNPYYYNQIYKAGLFTKDISEIVNKLLLSQNSVLQNEGREVLTQEFGNEQATFFSVLEAISQNLNTFTKINSYTKIAESILSRALNTLEKKFELIEKIKPVFPNNQKIFKYRLSNNFISFWFRYIFANQSLINQNATNGILLKMKENLNSLAGLTFEDFVMEFLLKKSNSNEFLFEIETFGQWWDKNSQIDMVVANVRKKTVLLGECKLSSEKVSLDLLEELKKKATKIDALKSFQKTFAFFCAEKINQPKRKILEENNCLIFDDF